MQAVLFTFVLVLSTSVQVLLMTMMMMNKGVHSEDSVHYDWECKNNSCDSEDNEEV